MKDHRGVASSPVLKDLIVAHVSGAAAHFTPAALADESLDGWDGNRHGGVTPSVTLPGVSGETRYQRLSSPDVAVKNDSAPLNSLGAAPYRQRNPLSDAPALV